MRYGSVCSGIEAASVAWDGLGWEASFFAEIDPFASAVLAHRFPNVRNLGDFTKIGADDCGAIDLLVGGTPCQDFSIAGLRAGMAGARGNLTLEFLRLAERLRPRWLLWENVPGVLSSHGGRDFGAFLGALAQLGYGFAYRVLDAQFYGVPQRRRRVFVVAHSGGLWQRAAAVLFEPEGVLRNPPPRGKAREDVAGTLEARSRGGGGGPGGGTDGACAGYIQPVVCGALAASTGGSDENDARDGRLVPVVAGAVSAKWAKGSGGPAGDEAYNLIPVAFTSKDHGADAGELSPTLRAMGHADSHANGGGQIAVAYAIQERAVCENPDAGPDGAGFREGIAYTLEARTKPQAVAYQCHGSNVGEMGTLRVGNGNVTGGVPFIAHALRGEGFDASEDGTGRGTPIVPVASTLAAGNLRAGGATGGNNPDLKNAVVERAGGRLAVRRLTPRECERLQGFPDGWTDIPLKRVKPGQCKSLRRDYPDRFRMIEGEEWLFAADGHRYKAIGNSMARPVMAWIGARIAFVDALPVCPPLAEAIVRANMPPRAEREAVA